MYYFKSLERPISNSELSEIEKKINVILPEDYKEFLLKVNVGIPKEQYLSFFMDDLNEEVILGTMLGISENKNFSLTDWNSFICLWNGIWRRVICYDCEWRR